MNIETSILPQSWFVPEVIRSRLGREAGPQRAMCEDGHLLIILHEIPEPDDHRRKPALFWRQPGGEWKSNLAGAGLAPLHSLLTAYDAKLNALEDAENKSTTAVEYHSVLERIAPVLRASRGLQRAMQQAREMAAKDRDLLNLRDQAAGIERTADLLLQDAQFGLNFTVARQAESQAASAKKMAATAHRLNLLAALFLPLTALASVFGMEIHSGIKDVPANFALILAVGVCIGWLVSLAVSRGR